MTITTRFRAVQKIGPVAVTAVTIDFFDPPTKYVLDCDNFMQCGWSLFGVTDEAGAISLAQEHAAFHEKNGAFSKNWRTWDG